MNEVKNFNEQSSRIFPSIEDLSCESVFEKDLFLRIDRPLLKSDVFLIFQLILLQFFSFLYHSNAWLLGI